jgi:hypothetical protein
VHCLSCEKKKTCIFLMETSFSESGMNISERETHACNIDTLEKIMCICERAPPAKLSQVPLLIVSLRSYLAISEHRKRVIAKCREKKRRWRRERERTDEGGGTRETPSLRSATLIMRVCEVSLFMRAAAKRGKMND